MSSETLVIAALSMGFLGSLHCSAMCGPLAAAGCVGQGRGRAALGYFAGRLVGYATVGALVGQLGQHALCLLPMEHAENVAVALTAIPAAARGLKILVAPKETAAFVPLRRGKPSALIRTVASLMPRRGLGLGLVTAVLPCGLLVAAWTLAASTASPRLGALVMALLALSSVPGLLFPMIGAGFVSKHLRMKPWLEGALWCALAAWLALRPLWVAAHCAVPSAALG